VWFEVDHVPRPADARAAADVRTRAEAISSSNAISS
jgi:hypothetical protein